MPNKPRPGIRIYYYPNYPGRNWVVYKGNQQLGKFKTINLAFMLFPKAKFGK